MEDGRMWGNKEGGCCWKRTSDDAGIAFLFSWNNCTYIQQQVFGSLDKIASEYLSSFVTLYDVAHRVTRVSGWPVAEWGLAGAAAC